MITIGTYFTEPNGDDYPFNEEEYTTAYREFGETLKKRGARLAVVRSMSTFLGGNRFAKGWIYDGGSFTEADGPVEPDLLFDKGFGDFAPDENTRAINVRELERICWKDETLRLFPEFSPVTFVAKNAEELASSLPKIPSSQAVTKPLNSEGGQGIFIGDKSEAANNVKDFPVLVQEFLDLRRGVPGIVEGVHDFRIIFIGPTIVGAIIRTPPPGGLLANVALGGTFSTLAADKIPADARAIAVSIDNRLSHIPSRVYSIDLGLQDGKTWKVIELNAPPALFAAREDPVMRRYHDALADHLLFFADAGKRL